VKKTLSRSKKQFPKNSKPLPQEMIGVKLCLPDDVDLSQMDWYDEPHIAAKSAAPVVTKPKPTLAEQPLADDEALRAFCAGRQNAADYFKAAGRPLSFLDCAGALSLAVTL
jgi:hypothetical protein